MEERKLKLARVFTTAICFGILIFCVTRITWVKLDFVRTAALILILAFFEMWQIRYPWGRPLRLGLPIALCVVAIRPIPEALIIYFIGSVLGRLVGKFDRISAGDFYHVFERVYILALAGLFYMWISEFKVPWDKPWVHYPGPANYGVIPNTYCNPVVINRAFIFPLAFLVMVVIFYLGETITSSIETGLVKSGSWRVILPHHIRQTILIYISLASCAGLMALYFPRIPWINFLIFALPLFIVRAESNRDKELDNRFIQTMRIIGDAVDLSRETPGHSSRVSNLSVEVARAMGLPENEVRDLRYAGALHDIGHISDISEGSARHPQAGADILFEIPRLRRVSEIVRYHHHQPLMDEGTGAGRVPVASKILNVVSEYDHLTNEPDKKMSIEEALQELSLERGKKYDSVVLRYLAQVLEKRKRVVEERPARERRQRAKVLEEMEIEASFEEIFREEEEE